MKHMRIFNKIMSVVLALTMVLSMLPMSVFATEATQTEVDVGEQTADLEIGTVEELRAFAAAVNAGDDFKGKTVILTNDISLVDAEDNVERMEPIGTKTNSFKGTFDGQGHTINELYLGPGDIDGLMPEDGPISYVGLFGRIDAPAVVKNVTVNNPYYVGTSYVGGIVGMGYTGTIENCHVTGEIDIEGNYMVGGINGHGYAKISGCSVVGEEGWDYNYIGAEYKSSGLEGDNVGGIVGHNGENNDIVDCTVKNVTVSGTRKVAGIVGITSMHSSVTGCEVSNVTVETTATAEYAADNAKTMSIGGVVGQYQASGSGGVISDVTVSGVTFKNENKVTVSAGALIGGMRGTSVVLEPAGVTCENNTVVNVTGSTVTYGEPAPAVPAVAKIGDAEFATLADALAAAKDGDVITVIADIVDEAVTTAANVTITGTATLNNVSITGGSVDSLTVSNLTFTGNSWINVGSAKALTVSGVTANAAPSNGAATNSRSAFISLGRSEGHEIDLTVTDCNVVVPSGTNPILGWAKVNKVTISGSTFGSASVYQNSGDSVKFMSIADGAELNFTGNTVYSNYNGIVLAQNTTRDNAYTANFSGNTFVGGADHIWIEISGGNTCHAAVNASSDNTINGNTLTAADIKAHTGVIKNWTSYAGVDVVTDAEGKVIGGTLAFAAADAIAEGYEMDENGKVVPSAPAAPAAAKIGDAEFATLADALAAAKTMTGNVTVEIYDKVTLNTPLNGSYDFIEFVGKGTDAEIYMDIQGAIYATGKTVAFEDLTLSKSVGGYVADAGFRNLAFGLYAADEVTYTNCVFANGAYASGNETFTNCEFRPSHDRYGLWVYGADTVLVDGCTFAEVRGIKMYNEAKTAMTDLTVKNTDFTNADGKPAIVLTYGESVTLENNTYSAKGVFELDLDGKPDGTAVTSDVLPTCVNDNGACGVLVDGKIYTTAAQAAEVAAAGSEVTLLHDSAETVEFVEGVNLNKNGFAAAGVTVKQSAPAYVAQIGEQTYATLEEAAAAAQAGDEIKLIADATLSAALTLPAGIALNGNGYQINGSIVAGGDLTFVGHTKVTNFNAGYNKPTITIGEGACLEMNGTGRMVIGHGATFNITGTIADAKTADKAALTPSLIVAAGASFTGAGVTFNVTNAYLKFSAYCSSKNSNASGTFDFNVTNSVWEQTSNLQFSVPTNGMDPTVNFELKDSVLTTTVHVIFGVTKGEIVIDNSKVNEGVYRQLENRSTMTIKNGSVVYASVQVSSNAWNPGTTIVDNATYMATGEFSGVSAGTGKLVLKNGANASVPKFGNATVELGAGCTLTTNVENPAITAAPGYDAVYENGVYTVVKGAVAKIGETKYNTLEDAFKAATAGCTIDILADVTVDYDWDNRYTGAKFTVPVTINGNGHTIKFTEVVYDGGNYMSAFRFEADAVVNDLIVDMSEAKSGFAGRFRAISAKANLTVDGCTFIGNGSANNTRAIIFGEGGTADSLANVAISVTDSEFTGWRQAIGDNESGKTEVKTVVITGNTMTDAGVNVSASDSITFTGNTVAGKYVKLVSYTENNTLNVTATGNTLTANGADSNYTNAGGTVDAQDDFVRPVTNVAEVNGVGYATLSEAFAAVTDDSQTVVILGDVTENLTAPLRGNITTKDGAKVTINLTNTDWVYLNYTFVLGENVTLKVPYMFYYAGGAQINGTVIANAYYQRYAGTKLTINEPGSLTVNTEMFYLRYVDGDPNAGIYVNGDGNDETIGLNASVIYFYQGMINAKDATIKTAVYWQTNETDGQGSANLVLDNTKMSATVNEQDVKVSGNSTATLTNGSVLTCARDFLAGDSAVISVDTTSAIIDKDGKVEFGLSGKGTETEPYLIKTVADLIKFRDSVNAGQTKYSAPGVYVALGADIDLTGENWVGIGSAYKDHGFMGNFDGKGFKVKNLTITNPTLDSDGYAYAGLFAVTEGTDANNQNVIKNLIIENVTISTTGDIVAAAIAYPYYTIVENVTVCGDINITGGDYTAGALAYTRRCVNASNVTVSGNAGSTITGTQVVGGVISDIQMNGGLTANYSNFAVSGVTITGGQMVGGISGIIATQSLNGASVKDVELVCTDRVGVYAGSFGGISTISNATYSNVEGATAEIGGAYKDAAPVAAKVNDTYYGTFAEAWAAANAGDTITLLTDLALASKLVVDKNVTIDGNGHSIIANHTAFILETGSDCTIKNVTLDTNNKAKGVKIASGNVVFDNVTIPNSNKSDAITVAAGSTLTLKTYFKAVTSYTLIDARSGAVNAEAGTVFDLANWRANVSPKTSDLKGAVDVNGKPFFCAYSSTTYYKSLSGVATTITDLTLLDDVALNSNLSVKGTLNLNGKTLTLAEGKMIKSSGNLTVVGEGSVVGEYVLTNATHTLTGPEGLNVTTTVADHEVAYSNGVYSVVEAVKVELPEVVVTDIKNTLTDSDPDLTFALNFAIKDVENLTQEYLDKLFAVYGDWYTDYVLTISGLTDTEVVFNANGGADGYLAGQYDAWSENWVSVPFENVAVQNGESLYIMEYAAKLMNKPGLRFTLLEVAEIVQNFDCGVYFTPEFLAANPDMKVELELKVFTEDEAGNKTGDISVAENNFEAKDIAAVVTAEGKQTRYFATLEAALAAAQDGETIVLVADIELTETLTIAKGKTVTLDLAGKTVTYNGTVQGEAMIANKGTLTINDSVGTGVINYNYTGAADSSYGIGNYTIDNAGTLTVNGGKITIAKLKAHAKYPINNNSTTGDAVVVINGGYLYNYNTAAIRQFCNSTAYQNSVTINGGLIEGYSAIWVQNPGKNTVNGTLTINGGEIKTTAAAYVNGTAELKDVASKIYFSIDGEGGAWSETSAIAINGGTFNENVYLAEQAPAIQITEGAAIFNGYLKLPIEPVAQIGEQTYATLADAVAAVQDGETITLLSDVIFNTQTRTHNSGSWYDGLYYIGDKSFTIDLAGFTIGQDGSVNDYLLNFKNAGAKANTIVLKNGTIDAGMAAFCAICTSSTSTQQITIDLEDVNLINNISNGSTAKIRGGAVLNVKNGAVITGQNSYLGIECVASTVNIYDGAKIYMNGTSSYNGCLVGVCGNGVVNVYGGYGKGAKGGFIAMTSGGTINVAGGEWIANTDGTVGNNSNLYVLTAQNNMQESGYAGASVINVTGGTFRGGMDAWVIDVTKGEVAELNISGGNFNADPTTYVDTTKYTVDARTDGTYLVGQLPDADVENLGTITVKDNEGDYKFDGSYYIYDLINGGKMTTATAPFDLTIAMDFTAKDSAEQAAANAFGQYTTDFYITMDGMANGSFVGDGCYLAGYYKSFGAWVLIPLDGFTVEDGKAYPVITSAGFDFSYEMICSDVKQFVCGIYLTPEVLEANPNLTVDLALGLSENKEAALNADFVTVDNYVYDADDLMPEAKLFGIYNSNMILDNSLAMNFYVKKSDIVEGEKYYIQVTKPYADGRADVVRIYEQEEWQNYSTDLYRVTFDGIAAKEMSDKLRVQVFYEDGAEASKVWEESIRDYAMFMLKQHADDKWGVLMVDMLNYGAAAQNHFKYAQDDLANKNLTAEQQELATEKVTATDHFQAGENGMFYNSTLVLNSNIVLNMYFKNVEADEGMYAKVAYTNHYGKAVNVTVPFAEFDQKGEGIYAVPVDELVVADGYQVVTIELYAADGTLLDRGAESVESYIYAMRNSEDPLYEMILKFITSAKASFAKN